MTTYQTRPSQPNVPHGDAATGKREVIMDAALALFVERGFYGTTVPEIATRASVGAGTIYRYFDSKEALVNALYRQEKTRWAHLVVDDFPGGAPTREQFRILFDRMTKYTVSHTESFIFMELHHHAAYLDAESRALEERMMLLFAHIIVAAQARGELKVGPPKLLMGLVMGAFIGVIRTCLDAAQIVVGPAAASTASTPTTSTPPTTQTTSTAPTTPTTPTTTTTTTTTSTTPTSTTPTSTTPTSTTPTTKTAPHRRAATLSDSDWKLVEQCLWETIRA